MINEFSNRHFACDELLPTGPAYTHVDLHSRTCAAVGAIPGAPFLNGDDYLISNFDYHKEHLWINLGIIYAIMTAFCGIYLCATEYISAQRSKGEVLIFRRGHLSKDLDEEVQSQPMPGASQDKYQMRRPECTKENISHAATFVWDSLDYEINVNGTARKILMDVEGWIKPGTLTALMGASGAGKTTLLNVLANRTSIGVIGGETYVDAKYRDDAFARKVGYAQQQDVHLTTSTVREALIFSAWLRQPKKYTAAEKIQWVDDLIETLDMSLFAEAVIGVPGEGLNVEQRKRVTIGVELAARPELLLFLGK